MTQMTYYDIIYMYLGDRENFMKTDFHEKNENESLKKFLTLPLKYDIIYMYLSDTKKLKGHDRA